MGLVTPLSSNSLKMTDGVSRDSDSAADNMSVVQWQEG